MRPTPARRRRRVLLLVSLLIAALGAGAIVGVLGPRRPEWPHPAAAFPVPLESQLVTQLPSSPPLSATRRPAPARPSPPPPSPPPPPPPPPPTPTAAPPPPPSEPPLSILVAVASAHFFGPGFEKTVPEFCRYAPGRPAAARLTPSEHAAARRLDCRFARFSGVLSGGQNEAAAEAFYASADALWYHLPGLPLAADDVTGGVVIAPGLRRWPTQVLVAASMESAAIYPGLGLESVMSGVDAEMSYRLKANITTPYLRGDHVDSWRARVPTPFAEKTDAAVFIQSRCGPPSGRDEIVWAIARLSAQTGGWARNGSSDNGTDITDAGEAAEPGRMGVVAALGACPLKLGAGMRVSDKIATLAKYRYCLMMENSVAEDYITERLFDAFVAGCVPIYYGAPNIAQLLPDPDSAIDFRAMNQSVPALLAELSRLSSNQTAYEAKLAWRRREPESLAPGFLRLLAAQRAEDSQCQLCRLLAARGAGRSGRDRAGGARNGTRPQG